MRVRAELDQARDELAVGTAVRTGDTARVDPRVVDAGGVLLSRSVAARWPAVARGRR
jgi:hypothetical protein